MKKEIKKEEDLVQKFWKNYKKADLFEREKLLKPIIKNFDSMFKIKDEKMRKQVLLRMLQSYFDDLLDYTCCK